MQMRKRPIFLSCKCNSAVSTVAVLTVLARCLVYALVACAHCISHDPGGLVLGAAAAAL